MTLQSSSIPTLPDGLDATIAALAPTMHAIAMPACLVLSNTKYAVANAAYIAMVGWPSDDIRGRTTAEVINATEYEQVKTPLEGALKSGEITSYIRRNIDRAGRERWMVVNYYPQRLPNGEVFGLIAMFTSADRLKTMERETQQHEKLLRSITDRAGLLIAQLDRELVFRFANQPFLDWAKLRQDEVIGNTLAAVFSHEALNFYDPFVKRALAGETFKIETVAHARARANEGRHLEVSFFPEVAVDGRSAGFLFMVRDIEKDYRVRQDLLARERRIRLITDNVSLPISYIDADHNVQFCNRAGYQWLKLTEADVLGKPLREVYGEAAAEQVRPWLDKVFAGQAQTYERYASNLAGTSRWIRGHMVPDFDESGKVVGVFTVLADIDSDVKLRNGIAEQERQIRLFSDNIPEAIFYLTRDRRFKFANNTYLHQHGVTRESVIGKTLAEVCGDEVANAAEPSIARAFAGETVLDERLVAHTPADAPAETRWLRLRNVPDFDESGVVQGIYVVGSDIHEIKTAEFELRRANWMLSSHFENTPLAVVEWGADSCVRLWSPQAERLFGWTEAEVIGKKIGSWNFIVEDDHADVMNAMTRMHQGTEKHTTSVNRNYRKDGSIIWCEWYNSNLTDENGQFVSMLSLAQDVSARVEAEERLIHQATHDSLTGLPNRTLLQDRLHLAIARARRNSTRIAALFIDLDRFKEVNDTLGHRVGDSLLRLIASRLRSTVRDSDVLVRISGDEFLVLLEQPPDLPAAINVAHKLLGTISEPALIEGHQIFVSGSIGISIFPDDADDADTLLRHADMAMYRAKEAGKNTYSVFTADLAEQSSNVRLIENALRASIAKNELELFYQPKVDIATNRIVGAEALIRWHHPERGLVLPGEFIALAEASGLVHLIGDWVLDNGIAQIKKWREEGRGHLQLAINLSAGQFHASNLCSRIIERVKRAGVDPACLELEITETSMLGDPEGVGRTISALRDFGIRIAIDDFGTGYSSLSHLKRFPIDTLKIDRSFVRDVLTDRDDAAIVTAVIALAKALEIDVVAEGVETTAHFDLLAGLKCDSFQGYLVSPALPFKQFEALVDAHNEGK